MLKSFSFILLLTVAGCFACYLFVRRFDADHAPFVILLFAPLFGRLLTKIVLELAEPFKRRAEEGACRDLQGNYYTFDEKRLRFYLVGPTVWVASEDLAKIMEPPPGERELRLLGTDHASLPGLAMRACSEAGLLRMVRARTSHRRASYHMVRFQNWLEKQALPNVKRLPSSAVACLSGWDEAGVIEEAGDAGQACTGQEPARH